MGPQFLADGLPFPTEDDARAQVLCVGVAAPEIAEIKDFLRFYAMSSRPTLDVVPTVDSINTIAEWFFAGFERVTQNTISKQDRSEVYNVSSTELVSRLSDMTSG